MLDKRDYPERMTYKGVSGGAFLLGAEFWRTE